jgi:2',3'-cyclic-nucleotide 2'-phosphodiesterase (5'-nucleotidase family)
MLKGITCVQPEAPPPMAAPLRELPWAQLNFLHTTDVHGWWGGHLQEYVILMRIECTAPTTFCIGSSIYINSLWICLHQSR